MIDYKDEYYKGKYNIIDDCDWDRNKAVDKIIMTYNQLLSSSKLELEKYDKTII